MLLSLLSGENIIENLAQILLILPIIMMALAVHETAHGFVAWKCGDNTAYNLGRLTLNPVKHLDPAGFLCMLVFGFGWAKPVPINTRNFKNPKWGMALSAAAGPVSNLLLGAVSAFLWGFFFALMQPLPLGSFVFNLVYWSMILFQLSAYVNFLYAVFNLIPVPPFDGSRIFMTFLPTRLYFKVMRYERQIMLVILVALLVLSRLGWSPFSLAAEWLSLSLADLSYALFRSLF